jgi:hypothetical protein
MISKKQWKKNLLEEIEGQKKIADAKAATLEN